MNRACVTSEDGLKKLVRPLSDIKSVCQCQCQTLLIIFSSVSNRTQMDGTVGLVHECGRMGCNMIHDKFHLNGNIRKSKLFCPNTNLIQTSLHVGQVYTPNLLLVQRRIVILLGHGHEQPGNGCSDQKRTKNRLQNLDAGTGCHETSYDWEHTTSELCADKHKRQGRGLDAIIEEFGSDRDALILSA